MNLDELEQLKQYEWDKFCRRYPVITGKNIVSKFLLLFKRDYIQRLIWENGFLQGWIQRDKHE